MDKSFSIGEAAQAMRVSTRTIRRYIKAGKLPAEMVPGSNGLEYRIPQAAIDTATIVVDVVKVERPTDPRILAAAVAAAVERSTAPLLAEIEQLRSQVKDLSQAVQSTAQAEEARAQARQDRDDQRYKETLVILGQMEQRLSESRRALADDRPATLKERLGRFLRWG